MWGSAVLVLPVLPFFPIRAADARHRRRLLALGVLCSGIAYLIYFRLIAEVGRASALTVTFLNPLFGILWGALFLGERSAGTHSRAHHRAGRHGAGDRLRATLRPLAVTPAAGAGK